MFLNVLFSCWYLHSLSFPQWLFPSLFCLEEAAFCGRFLFVFFSRCVVVSSFSVVSVAGLASLVLSVSLASVVTSSASVSSLASVVPRRIYRVFFFLFGLGRVFSSVVFVSSAPPPFLWSSTPPESESGDPPYRQRPLPLSLFALLRSRDFAAAGLFCLLFHIVVASAGVSPQDGHAVSDDQHFMQVGTRSFFSCILLFMAASSCSFLILTYSFIY